jgi:hypothetical protein
MSLGGNVFWRIVFWRIVFWRIVFWRNIFVAVSSLLCSPAPVWRLKWWDGM